MNLYLLEIDDPEGRDTVSGFIIRAPSEESARMQASANARDEGIVVWLDSGRSTCTPLTIEGPIGIILRDFHAG